MRKQTTKHSARLTLAVVLAILIVGSPLVMTATASAESLTAKDMLEATGVQGGLVVQLGCGDGQRIAALGANDRYLVQALDVDSECVTQTRQLLHAQGLHGKTTAETFDGRHLPYVDNLVNLLAADELGDVTMDEVMRVLAPRGIAFIRQGDRWIKTVKPRPEDIDQWTHFLHDAGGNAVAQDRRIGPPKGLRWVAGPRWCRSHEYPSSVQAVVATGERIFTIFDEGPTGVYRKLPQRCQLVARDAANGVLLWKVPMRDWQEEHGTGTGGRWSIHHTIPRRLVAQGDRVYVTLGFLDSPVSVLDAATGEILVEALPGTHAADEILLSDGVLIVKSTPGRSVGATVRFGKETLDDTLAAIDVETGKQLWRKENTPVIPYALSAADRRVVHHNMDELVCLDTRTGETIWRTPNPIASTAGGGSTLVITDGVVLYHGQGKAMTPGTPSKKQPAAGLYLTALSLDDGKLLWQDRGGKSLAGACTQPTDVFVAGGNVWCGTSLTGRDLHTGQPTKTLSIGNVISPGHHYRCHRAKATERFLIWPKRGAEFLDVEGNEHTRNDWLRAPCFTGATPANGLFYVPPDQCFCYPGVKVSGYLAMTPKPASTLTPSTNAALERGPAYAEMLDAAPASRASHDDWPMHRRDVKRSGSTPATVSVETSAQWQVKLACQGSQSVVVGNRLFVAEKDAHRITCLDATTGDNVWSFTAGGRIDSAPTIHDGRVLFGCRDGSVYCLRASDGVLAWRFLAAPDSRQIVSFGQLESVWPVQGSVLAQDDVVYFAAGRSSFLDGGILAYGLNVKTGEVLHHHLLEGPWPNIEENTGRPFDMEGALPDLFVSDGKDLYMRRIKFDAQLNRVLLNQDNPLGELDMGANHLVATGGLLDDTGFDRLFWMHGKRWPGFYFAQHSPKAGQLVVFDESTTYAVKYFYRRFIWSPMFIPAEHGYLLFADDNDNEPVLMQKGIETIDWLPKEAASDRYRRGGRGVEKGTGYCRQSPAKWQTMIPLRVRAMLLAGDRLFVAGTPDVCDPEDPLAAFEGRVGALLQVFSTQDGSLRTSQPLPSLPAFDGLSTAAGRLYLSTQDGRVICFGKNTNPRKH